MSNSTEGRSSDDRKADRQYVLSCIVTAVGLLVLIGLLFWPGIQRSRRGQQPNCKNHLRQIGFALHNYHDKYLSLPPAFVRGPDGQPWHSWRVLVLPFMGQQKLYDEYRFDEPWNGPHNQKLLKQRPEVFQCPQAKGKIPSSDTSYVAVVGSETAWPAPDAISLGDLRDGSSNVILVVEVRDAGVPWLAPDDLMFEEACVVPSDKSGRRLSSFHVGGSQALLGDGAAKFIYTNIDASTLKGLLTRDGGETLGDF